MAQETKFYEIMEYNRPEWRIPCAILTRFSEFMEHFMTLSCF